MSAGYADMEAVYGASPSLLARLWDSRVKYLVGALCILIITVTLLPLVASLTASIKTTGEAAATPPTLVPRSFSLQSYEELCFWSRVEADSSTLIQVHLLRGGQHYTRELSLSEAWTRYCLPLADFTNLTQEVLVPNELIALQFFFAPMEPFRFWVDDVEAVRN